MFYYLSTFKKLQTLQANIYQDKLDAHSGSLYSYMRLLLKAESCEPRIYCL